MIWLALVAGLCIGFVAGWLAGAPFVASAVQARCDFEWANFLENHIVGPTQTKHPRRGNG